MSDPRVGVTVLTYNRVADVTRTLEHLLALPESPRIVVVDNASRDGTPATLRAGFPGVEVLTLARNEGAAGRNVGVKRLTTPYVALCDDDTWWTPGSLARVGDLLDRHPALGAVVACVAIGEDGREDPTCALMAASPLPRTPGLPGTPILGLLAGATVVRRAAFLAAGGFEPRLFLGAEEQLLAVDLAALGWAIAYVPELTVHHHPSALRDARARRRLIARNALWFAWLRRPAPAALAATARAARRALVRADAAWGFAAALPGLPWALLHRRVVAPAVEQRLRLLDAHVPEAAAAPAPPVSAASERPAA